MSSISASMTYAITLDMYGLSAAGTLSELIGTQSDDMLAIGVTETASTEAGIEPGC